jgi:cytochrome P450
VTGVPAPVTDFDPYDPALTEPTVWAAYAAARAVGPVVRSRARGGFWLATRYDDVRAALRDPATYSSASGHRLPVNGTQRAIPIDFDPPLHTSYRRLMTESLSPARVRQLTPLLERTVRDLVAEFAAAGGGDFVRAVALPLPLQVLTEVVGFSAGTVQQFRELTEDMWSRLATEDDTVDFAAIDRRIHDLMHHELAEHRTARPDDFVTRLLDAEVDGRVLEPEEQAGILATFAVAGHETTMNSASSLVHLLAEHPDLQDRVRADPTLAPRYVEEMVRLRSPAQGAARRTACPADLGGTHLTEGDAVLLALAAANRDPARFTDPDRFAPDRDTRGHLGFGWGIHQCLGAPLARAELAILLTTLCAHPPLRAAGAPTWSGLRGGSHFGPATLPVRFEEGP